MASDSWRLTATETPSLKAIAAVDDILNASEDIQKLSRRIDAIPMLREQVEALQNISATVIARLWLSIPPEQRSTIGNQLRYSEMHIGVKSAAKEAGFAILTTAELLTLVDAALGMQCYLCPKTDAQAHTCPLRKVLDSLTVHTRPRVRGCSYREGYIEEIGLPWPQP